MLIKTLKCVTSGSRSGSPPKPKLFCSLGFSARLWYNQLLQSAFSKPPSGREEGTNSTNIPNLGHFLHPIGQQAWYAKVRETSIPNCQTHQLPSAERDKLLGGSPFLDCAPHGKRGAGSLRVTGSGIILGADLKCRFLNVIRNRDFSGCISGLYITHPLLDSSMFSESWDTVLGS